jgi:hypothetical protein
MSMTITSHANGDKETPGPASFTLSGDQEIIGPTGANLITCQFSIDPGGPWITSREYGGGGAITVGVPNPVAYDEQNDTFTVTLVRLNANETYIRAATWLDTQWNEGEEEPEPGEVPQNVSDAVQLISTRRTPVKADHLRRLTKEEG